MDNVRGGSHHEHDDQAEDDHAVKVGDIKGGLNSRSDLRTQEYRDPITPYPETTDKRVAANKDDQQHRGKLRRQSLKGISVAEVVFFLFFFRVCVCVCPSSLRI